MFSNLPRSAQISMPCYIPVELAKRETNDDLQQGCFDHFAYFPTCGVTQPLPALTIVACTVDRGINERAGTNQLLVD
jgi:hypothetical protein